MMLWPRWYSPSGASLRRKLHTLSSIGPHILGNSGHVAAATTTAVGVGWTVLIVTSTVMARIICKQVQNGSRKELVGALGTLSQRPASGGGGAITPTGGRAAAGRQPGWRAQTAVTSR